MRLTPLPLCFQRILLQHHSSPIQADETSVVGATSVSSQPGFVLPPARLSFTPIRPPYVDAPPTGVIEIRDPRENTNPFDPSHDILHNQLHPVIILSVELLMPFMTMLLMGVISTLRLQMLVRSILDNLKGGSVQITCWGLLLIWELWAMLLMCPLHPYNPGTKVRVVRCMR